MRTTIQHTSKIVSAAWLFILILSGCGQTELDGILPDSDDSSTGEPVELRISLADSPEYNNETTSTPATRSGKPLVAEWVKVNSFSATRSAEEYEGPAIAAMELFEDTITSAPQTRATMTAGYYFRVIAFRKSGSSYVFQSVADYTANGASAPVLKQGKLACSMGQTYRFVAYSFNNNDAMATMPSSYTWSTAISIPNLSNDFMTFDSGDVKVSGETFALSVVFTHQLCKLTVKIGVAGFESNTFANVADVYIKECGNAASWTIGGRAINANTSNTAPFNIADNSTATTRLVPFTSERPITVHFGKINVGGKAVSDISITSSQRVKLRAGKRYTMEIQFKKQVGKKVSPDDIPIMLFRCKGTDKSLLTSLLWAEGNLAISADGKVTMATPTEIGSYLAWNSTSTQLTPSTRQDPCSQLDEETYGAGWRMMTPAEGLSLVRCAVPNSTIAGTPGSWFIAADKGIYIRSGGYMFKNQNAWADRNSCSWVSKAEGESPEDDPYVYYDRINNILSTVVLTQAKNTVLMPVRCVKEPV